MIPKNISKDHILRAIQEIDKQGIPEYRQSEKYVLEYNNFLYSPKYVISLSNLFANNQELSSAEFSGGMEANIFLQERGFRILNKPRLPPGQKWLVVTGMKLAGICKVLSDYYYEESKLWKNGIYPHRVKIEVINRPPEPIEVKRLYDVYFGYKGKSGGYFAQAIRPIPDNEFSIFQSELARSNNELEDWEQSRQNEEPEELISREVSSNTKSEPSLFITSYDEKNLEVSIRTGILGWKRQPKDISKGDIVFVYNSTSKRIQAGFRIKGEYYSDEPLWHDETSSEPPIIIYKFRYEADVLCNSLDIDFETIKNIEPFKATSEGKAASFHILVIVRR